WLVSMIKLNKLRPVKDELLEELRESIEEESEDKNVAAILFKDAHLIEAALATDLRVVSLDDAARGHFCRLAASVDSLQRVVWVNPVIEGDEVIDWLTAGAPDKPARRLKP